MATTKAPTATHLKDIAFVEEWLLRVGNERQYTSDSFLKWCGAMNDKLNVKIRQPKLVETGVLTASFKFPLALVPELEGYRMSTEDGVKLRQHFQEASDLARFLTDNSEVIEVDQMTSYNLNVVKRLAYVDEPEKEEVAA
jgi:hypothetical protein